MIYGFNVIPVKIPASYLVDIDKQILKFIWRLKRSRTANNIEREEQSSKSLSDFKTYYKAIVIKTM